MTLSKLSSYVYLFGNDVRLLHLHTTGVHFFEYHEKLNELYDILFNFYDALAESAITHNEEIGNPSELVLDESLSWEVLEGKDFDVEEITYIVLEKGKIIMSYIEETTGYESWIQSKIDSFAENLDTCINYMFKQSAK